MPDKEKVIKGLEHCDFGVSDTCYEKECPYYQSHDCTDELKNDILVLLKEKEPKQIVHKQGKRENSDGSIDYFVECYCPHCGKLLNRGFDIPWAEFCYKCGKAVKWE